MKKHPILKILLLAMGLSIVSEVICFGYSWAHPKGDGRLMNFFYAFHAPSVWAAYRLFPILGDMDDHDTGKEGGMEDTLGTAIMFGGPVVQWFILCLGGILIFKLLTRLGTRSKAGTQAVNPQ